MIGTIRQVLEQPPTPVRTRNPEVPPDLAAICTRCLERHPACRYAEAGELVDVLGRFLRGNQGKA